MHFPPIPDDEEQRLTALRRYAILDTEPEPAFDRLTRLGAQVFDVPMVLVSLVDQNRQWFKSCYGLSATETTREVSFCAHTILGTAPLIVPDAASDPRFSDNPFVTNAPGIRFYAGAPLIAHDGARLGAFCLIDIKPRPALDSKQTQMLEDFAALVVEELELRRTARELADSQKALQAARERFHALMDESPAIVFIKEQDGRLIYISKAAARTFGIDEEECLGRLDHELWPQDVAADMRAKDISAFESGKLTSSTDVIRINGELRFFHTLRFPFRDADGRVLIGGNAFDITERRQLEHELRRQTARAEEANRLKSEFLGNISHELRTPLNGIIGFSELLVDGKAGNLTERQQRFMSNILVSSRHLLHLINDLLDLAMIEAGRLDMQPENGSSRVVTGEVVDSLEPLAALKQITVSVDVDGDAEEIYADPARFRQVVYNYASNALKFTPEGGRIRVHISRESDGATRLDVEDTGIGIASENLPRLFEKFQQLEGGMARRFGGTGLGLSLVKKLVEQHGGRVEVRSEVGVGSTFSAVFPPLNSVPDSEHATISATRGA